MRIIVLGAGVVGTASAYYLAQAGAEVTVIDRQPGPGLETSHANAGQVSPGYSTPWAAPGIPAKAIKWLFQRHAPLSIRPDGSLHQWQWILQMLAQCTLPNYQRNKERMMRLAEYSRDCLRQLREETGIAYEQRMGGTLQLLRTDAQMLAVARDTAVLRDCGVPFDLLQPHELARFEPALASVQDRLAGGLRLPNDETGDCYRFTYELAELARAQGVRFMYGQTVTRLSESGNRVSGVQLESGPHLRADAYVLALASYSRALLRPLGIDLPVYPVKGYSLTLPMLNEERAPRSTVLDETYKVAITRFDQRIRVGGMAELSGFDLQRRPRRRETLEMVVQDLFPAGDLQRADFWTGLRPMTPDSTPIVGGTPIENLYLNTGHGTLGWTMAAGSGQLLADLIMRRTPAISVEGLAMDRYVQAARRRRNTVTRGRT